MFITLLTWKKISPGILKGQIEDEKSFPWVGLKPKNLNILGQKYTNIFVRFLVQMKNIEFAFEINWPLGFESNHTLLSIQRIWNIKNKVKHIVFWFICKFLRKRLGLFTKLLDTYVYLPSKQKCQDSRYAIKTKLWADTQAVSYF